MQTRKTLRSDTAGSIVRTRTRSRDCFLNVIPLIFVWALIWPFGGSKIVMTNSPSAPAAKGVLSISRDSNDNTKIKMEVRHLAQPSALSPAGVDYVVWVQAKGHSPQNQGVLKIGNDRRGKFNMVTPFKDFAIFVTAEQSSQTPTPEGEKVLTADVSG